MKDITNRKTLKVRSLRFPSVHTDPIPTANLQGTLSLLNLLVRENRGTWLSAIPGIRGFKIVHFTHMDDEHWIEVHVKDEILGATIPIVVPSYSVFGFSLAVGNNVQR